MKVYVLQEERAYEGSLIISIHSTLDGAKQAAEQRVLELPSRRKWETNDWALNYWGDEIDRDVDGEHYRLTIQEKEVEA